jgi:aryl-alcohol dehydrogenase-like predicted oxidoreductase
VHQWIWKGKESRPIVKKALDIGIHFFDIANVYSIGRSEEIVGYALKDYGHHNEIVVATKVWGEKHKGPNGKGLSRKQVYFLNSLFLLCTQ